MKVNMNPQDVYDGLNRKCDYLFHRLQAMDETLFKTIMGLNGLVKYLEDSNPETFDPNKYKETVTQLVNAALEAMREAQANEANMPTLLVPDKKIITTLN